MYTLDKRVTHMRKMFLLNLLRGIIINLIAVVPTIILGACFYGAFVKGLGFVPNNATVHFIVGGVFSGISGIILVSICMFKDGLKFVFDFEKHVPYFKAYRIFLGLIVHLILAIGAILIMIYWKESLTVLVIENSNWIMVCYLVAAIAVFQILYFLGISFWYLSRLTCWTCGNIFCLVKDNLISETNKDYTEYKTETDRKQLGSIYAGNNEVAKVYGDVDTTYSRDVHAVTRKYNCHCRACQKTFQITETSRDYKKWE